MRDISIFIFILYNCIGITLQAEWTYENQNEWPGKCNSGHRQSPMALATRGAVHDWHGTHIRAPLRLQHYSNVTMYGLNNGHTCVSKFQTSDYFTVKWNVVPSSDAEVPTLSGGPLLAKYKLLQFHLHWLSEHAIDGYKYPLEIHLVHVRTDVDSLDEALALDDGLAVLGVMCQVSSGLGSEKALEQIMVQVPGIVTPVDATPEIKVDINRLLSPAPHSFFTYSGSLTTPQCQEAVTWIVMDHPITISDEQYLQITRAEVGGFHNYRRLQPTNRVVYHSASCASALAPPALAAATSLLYCLAGSLGQVFSHVVCKVLYYKNQFFGQTIRTCVANSI